MTATVSNLIKLITDMGYPITVAAYLDTKKPQQRWCANRGHGE